MKNKIKGLKNIGGTDILNAIRNDASTEYQERIPEATKNNIADIGNALLNYNAGLNEFLGALVNRIGLVVIKNRLYSNPLKEFKKGMLNYGDTIEEIFVEIAKAKHYDVQPNTNNLGDVFEVTKPKVLSRFHKVNRQDFYPVTINQDILRRAFLSEQNLDDFISKIFDSLYSADEYDEFLLMKNLIGDARSKNKFYDVQVPEVTNEETAKEFAVITRQYANNLRFMSNKYNNAGVTTYSDIKDQVILINSKYEARMSVDVLAYAFNMEKADFLSRMIIVDDFGGNDTDDTVALLVDKDWFMVYDQKIEMTEQYNARHLYWNYFLHHWQVISSSDYAPAIRFTTSAVTPLVESVEILPSAATVKKGETEQFTANVVTKYGASKDVTYEVKGAKQVDTGTTVSENGLLTVGVNETNTKLEVICKSVADITKTSKATVTVTE